LCAKIIVDCNASYYGANKVSRFILRFFLVVTEEEREIIKEEAKRRGMEDEESNIIREALRLYFDRYGTKLPEGAFADRKRGNKSKSDLQPVTSELEVA
jgi:hypothetical protein